ncbi:DNA topoisomerase 1-like isoform X3 [Anguilla anguilla]|uniref:DNA topoisomerase 1-like isoform X3 n=1 Tax=Anguilla anguilla TaxID=7936 RepID=UPI0015AD0A95|nr:DNA topoisomerase 1-like isoform X3 [Anguilla anguilla]
MTSEFDDLEEEEKSMMGDKLPPFPVAPTKLKSIQTEAAGPSENSTAYSENPALSGLVERAGSRGREMSTSNSRHANVKRARGPTSTDSSRHNDRSRHRDGSRHSNSSRHSDRSGHSVRSRHSVGSRYSERSRHGVGSRHSVGSRYSDSSRHSVRSRHSDGSRHSVRSRHSDRSGHSDRPSHGTADAGSQRATDIFPMPTARGPHGGQTPWQK